MSHSVATSKTTLNANCKYSNINSSVTTYLTLPVALKAIQVVVGIACVGIAAQDLLNNFQDLASLSAAVVAKHTSRLREVLEAIQRLLNMGDAHDHVFIDQMTCRMVFLSVSSIFLIISLIQFTWFPASLFTGPLKSRIISGIVCHLVGFGMHLVASLNLLARIDLLGSHFINNETVRTIAIVGLANGALYLLSGVVSLWYFIENKICRSETSSKPPHHVLSTQPIPIPISIPTKSQQACLN